MAYVPKYHTLWSVVAPRNAPIEATNTAPIEVTNTKRTAYLFDTVWHAVPLIAATNCPPSESVKRHSPCGIRGLAKNGRRAPIMTRRVAHNLTLSGEGAGHGHQPGGLIFLPVRACAGLQTPQLTANLRPRHKHCMSRSDSEIDL